MQLIKSNVTEIRLIYTVVILLGDNFHVVTIVEAYSNTTNYNFFHHIL
jgi:hypothetical protein